MDVEPLGRLIARGETLTVEFKGEEKAPLSDRELVEAVVCMANRNRHPEAPVPRAHPCLPHWGQLPARKIHPPADIHLHGRISTAVQDLPS
jgi:hypothetical protein